MQVSEIPLTASNQMFAIKLGDQNVKMRLIYRDIAGWVMDIQNNAGVPLLVGAPLIPGINLLEQYPYLGIEGMLVIASDADSAEYPTSTNLGLSSHLYFVQQ
ncbi:phage baseplate plug family protein [Photorhabdus sp. SF281]|uniref:phage baseplate plug family protein n=1 Tax=Photorhabdus sp. SF281 TaxID=3459527 RepID=UPI0040441DA4